MSEEKNNAQEIASEVVPEDVNFVAAVTLRLPNKTIGKRIIPGATVLAKQRVPKNKVTMEWLQNAYSQGHVFEEETPPKLRDVRKATGSDGKADVSSVVKGEQEENPLDGGINLKAGDKDPQIAARLSEIAAQQAEDGKERDGSDPDPASDERSVEVNAETGETTETGDTDPSFEDEADAQVS